VTAIPKPRRGRPPTLVKKKSITLDVPAELLERMTAAAKAAGKPRAEWLRELAEEHLKSVPHG